MDERPVELAVQQPSGFLPVPSLFPELEEAPEAPDPARLSDVDEWGRSEHFRSAIRRIYGPMYRNWFRVEWEGLEKIPSGGGALLVANHAGAIPSDAPVVMHGIEEELGRPVYGLADYFFRTIPFVGTMWQRGGGVPARPENAYRLLREQGQLVLSAPRGIELAARGTELAPRGIELAARGFLHANPGRGRRRLIAPKVAHGNRGSNPVAAEAGGIVSDLPKKAESRPSRTAMPPSSMRRGAFPQRRGHLSHLFPPAFPFGGFAPRR